VQKRTEGSGFRVINQRAEQIEILDDEEVDKKGQERVVQQQNNN
jgi:hypothetical protein